MITKKEMYLILEKEGLKGWKIKKSTSGYYCMLDSKKIVLRTFNFALFLHEVAHAKAGVRKEKTGHDAVWGDEFTRLVDSYMVYNEGIVRLLENGGYWVNSTSEVDRKRLMQDNKKVTERK